MADLAPRGYGAGAYGRAPYGYYGYIDAVPSQVGAATQSRVPLFLVKELPGALGGSSVAGSIEAFRLVFQVSAVGSALGQGAVLPQTIRNIGAGGSAVSDAYSGIAVILGRGLFSSAKSYGQASVNAVRISFSVRGASYSDFVATKQVSRPMAAGGSAESAGMAVLSPLWGCGKPVEAMWECSGPQPATWEEATAAQSTWRVTR